MANQFDFLAFPKSFPIPPITFHCHFLVPTPVFFVSETFKKHFCLFDATVLSDSIILRTIYTT